VGFSGEKESRRASSGKAVFRLLALEYTAPAVLFAKGVTLIAYITERSDLCLYPAEISNKHYFVQGSSYARGSL